MSQMTTDETLERFLKIWRDREPLFSLDDPKVRENLMVLLSASLSVLSQAPEEVANDFMERCANIAKEIVPEDVQDKIIGRRTST